LIRSASIDFKHSNLGIEDQGSVCHVVDDGVKILNSRWLKAKSSRAAQL
jgi:hypothetical protein